MKKQFTRKAIKNMKNYTVLAIGFCNLQHLLTLETPFGFSTGISGWDCDYYYSPDYEFIISMGNRPVGQEVSRDLCKKYENLAIELIEKHLKSEDLKVELQKLISEFVAEVK